MVQCHICSNNVSQLFRLTIGHPQLRKDVSKDWPYSEMRSIWEPVALEDGKYFYPGWELAAVELITSGERPVPEGGDIISWLRDVRDTLYWEFTKEVCLECFSNNTGVLPDSIKPLRANNSFELRTLQGSIAVEIVRSMFQHCGYAVRNYGQEHAVPEWIDGLKAGDPNPVAAKLKSSPNLLVYQHSTNDAYEIEVKSTNQPASRWQVGKEIIDTQRHYHPDAILIVFVQNECEIYVGVPRLVDWDSLPTLASGDGQVDYSIDLPSAFIKPNQHFEKVMVESYLPFLEGVKVTLAGFSS